LSSRLENALGYRFKRQELLRQALTHRSHSTPHNERLEFLGDSVLNCVIAALLFDQFPSLREGELSRLRANLVRQESLAEIAADLGLGDVLHLGEGELKSGGFRRPSILADALEAIFGAIYVDAGFESARSAIEHLYRQRIETIDPRKSVKDAKTALQEWLQGRRLPLPHYSLVETHGEVHAQEFVVDCSIPSVDLQVVGRGPSRRAAEQEAAQAALGKLTQP
jgi:ribonuclease III